MAQDRQDIDDVRESPALDVIELLRQKGADVRYHDPYVSCICHNGYQIQGEPDLAAGAAPPGELMVVSVVMVLVLLATGLFYFRRMERIFPDVV